MRISVDERYAGHAVWLAHGGHAVWWRVTLDGVEVRHCVVADEELGEVLVHAEDGPDRLLVEGDRLAERWRRGAVVISRP